MPTRVIASYPATAAVTTARPLDPPASPSASTVGKITDEAWVIEMACVSSKSSPCAKAPLASAASGGGAVRLEPMTLQAPRPQPFTAEHRRRQRGSRRGERDAEDVERQPAHVRDDGGRANRQLEAPPE